MLRHIKEQQLQNKNKQTNKKKKKKKPRKFAIPIWAMSDETIWIA